MAGIRTAVGRGAAVKRGRSPSRSPRRLASLRSSRWPSTTVASGAAEQLEERRPVGDRAGGDRQRIGGPRPRTAGDDDDDLLLVRVAQVGEAVVARPRGPGSRRRAAPATGRGSGPACGRTPAARDPSAARSQGIVRRVRQTVRRPRARPRRRTGSTARRRTSAAARTRPGRGPGRPRPTVRMRAVSWLSSRLYWQRATAHGIAARKAVERLDHVGRRRPPGRAG